MMSSLTGQERNGWLKGRTVEVELRQTHVVQGTLGVTQSSGKRVMIGGQSGLGSKTLPKQVPLSVHHWPLLHSGLGCVCVS